MSSIITTINDKINSLMLYTFGRESYGVIIRVIKGDTFEYACFVSEKSYIIKLYNIETPAKGQQFYQQSIDFANKVLIGTMVKLQVYIYNDKFHVKMYYQNKKRQTKHYESVLLFEGLAYYKGDLEDDQTLRAMQTVAQKSKKNIWSIRQLTPWDYREKQKQLKMLEYEKESIEEEKEIMNNLHRLKLNK
jgi:endonuclease YncB( thermonuclease family)